MADVVLIPGLWLYGASWAQVTPMLRSAGHRSHPLTLPGMESRDADRAGITLRDHVDAVVAAVDACGQGEKVLVVAHSAGCGIGHAAVDARPDRVARAIYIGGFPIGDGVPVVDGFEVVGSEIPLPEWSSFDESELVGLDDEGRRKFRERAIPSPAGLQGVAQRLSDERRYDVPVTVVAPEFTTAMLHEWIKDGLEPVQELTRIRDVEYVDLPTGHWPQFTRPDDLARVILERVSLRSET